MMKLWIAATIAALVAAAPTAARACSSIDLQPGLSLASPGYDRTIFSDGVIALDGVFLGTGLADSLASLAVVVTQDGAPVSGAVEVLPLYSGPTIFSSDVLAGAELIHQFVLVWRPAAPLGPGTLVVTVMEGEREHYGSEYPLEITVVPGSAAPIEPAVFSEIRGEEFVADVYEQVCCESGVDSCGYDSECHPTELRREPGFTMRAVLPDALHERAYLWVASVEDGVLGERVPTHEPVPRFSDYAPMWASWSLEFPLRFHDARPEYCVVLGVTSLIDGETAVSEPHCEVLPAPRDESVTPQWYGECLTPPVYAHNGEPYDDGASEPAAQGCRVAAHGTQSIAWLLVLAAFTVRRRRGDRFDYS